MAQNVERNNQRMRRVHTGQMQKNWFVPDF